MDAKPWRIGELPELLSVSEAAAFLRVSRVEVWTAIATGELVTVGPVLRPRVVTRVLLLELGVDPGHPLLPPYPRLGLVEEATSS